MNRTRIALLGLAALGLAGCSQTTDRQAAIHALKDTEARWNQDYIAKDLDKLVAHYTDNAVLMSPGEPAATGPDGIRKIMKEMVDDPAMSLKFQASRVEVSQSGEMGYTQGSYKITMTDPATKKIVEAHGSYVTTYAKQSDGSWKAVADIATPDGPSAPPPTTSAQK